MAKLSYLNLINRIMRRVSQSAVTDVTNLTGHGQVVADLINEAQTTIYQEEDWYALHTTRKWKTVTYTAATIAAASGTPDTFTDSANGFVTAGFQDGQQILVSGFTDADSNGVWQLADSSGVAAGTLTLQTADTLVDTEAASNSITITAISYPVASDHGKTLSLTDITNGRKLIEDYSQAFDSQDPSQDSTNLSSHFSLEGGFYRLHYVPSGAFTLKERYLKVPATLATNTATSDLPIECENLIMLYAHAGITRWLKQFEYADRLDIQYRIQLAKAKKANKRKLNIRRAFTPSGGHIEGFTGITPPSYPAGY